MQENEGIERWTFCEGESWRDDDNGEWMKYDDHATVVDRVSPRWISVDERLPELHATVALLDERTWMNTGSDDHSVNWHGVGYLCEFGQKYWSVFGATRSQCLDSVTHWMPLPPPPA